MAKKKEDDSDILALSDKLGLKKENVEFGLKENRDKTINAIKKATSFMKGK